MLSMPVVFRLSLGLQLDADDLIGVVVGDVSCVVQALHAFRQEAEVARGLFR